jgi:hypothetical protein
LLREQIEIVQRGDDPICVIRDPERNQVLEMGPSRVWDGTRWVPKPWTGWRSYESWKSPVVAGTAQRSID